MEQNVKVFLKGKEFVITNTELSFDESKKFYDVQISEEKVILLIASEEKEKVLLTIPGGNFDKNCVFTTLDGREIKSSHIYSILEDSKNQYLEDKNVKDYINQTGTYVEDDEVFFMENLTFNDKVRMLTKIDFTLLLNENGSLSLKDHQGGNLSNIESETFEDIDSIMSRLENYWNDMQIYFL